MGTALKIVLGVVAALVALVVLGVPLLVLLALAGAAVGIVLAIGGVLFGLVAALVKLALIVAIPVMLVVWLIRRGARRRSRVEGY
jgi:hypothetical protein